MIYKKLFYPAPNFRAMKRLLCFSFVLLQLISGKPVIAADSSYILLRIKGKEWVPPVLDNGHFLQQQILTTLQNEFKKKPVLIILSDDSLQAQSTRFNFIIEVTILELHVNEPVILQQNLSVSRDVTTNTYKDESEDLKKEHTTVYADMIITEKSMSALLRMGIHTTKLPEVVTLWSEIVAESFNWENKSATYTGNYQALGSKEIVLARTKPKPTPKETEVYKAMVRQCINKSSRQIANSIIPKTAG